MTVKEIARSEDEAKKTLRLDLRKKKQVVKQRKAQSNWMKNTLVKRLVHELVKNVRFSIIRKRQGKILLIFRSDFIFDLISRHFIGLSTYFT